jgi:polysaccharide transporter, PST family
MLAKITGIWLSLNATLLTHKALAGNFLALSVVQLTNFILPLITYPYLFRIIGDSHFGSVVYAMNVMLFMTTFIDYGFNLSAPRSIALARNNSTELSQAVCIVLQTKFYLLIICCVALAIFLLTIPKFSSEIHLYLYCLIYLTGSCVMPLWLFQGMERMKNITWINLLAKVGFTCFVFLMVTKPSEYIYIIGLYGLANLVSGIIGLWRAWSSFHLKFYWHPIGEIWKEIQKGIYFFGTSFASVSFSNSTLFILGFMVSDQTMGRYGIAEKITMAVWQLITVFYQVTYPIICRLAKEGFLPVAHFFKMVYIPFIILIGLICLTIFTFATQIVILFSGSPYTETINYLMLLAFMPLIIGLNVPAHQILLAFNKEKQGSQVFNIALLFSLVISTPLSYLYGGVGAALSAISIQLFLTISLHWTLAARNPSLSIWSYRTW